MNHIFSGNKMPNGIQSPASTKSASLQQPQPAPKTRKVLPITDPKKKQAVAASTRSLPSTTQLSKSASSQQVVDKPRKHALAIVHPESKAQILPPAPESVLAGATATVSSGHKGSVRGSKHLIRILDPVNKQAVQLPHSSPAVSQAAQQLPDGGSQQPVKRVLQILDPQNKEAIALPAKPDQSGNSQISRTVSSSSAAVSDHSRAGRRLSIVDPQNKQPVQLPVRSDSLGSNSLHRSVSSISAASVESGRTGKHLLTIVDPQNKELVQLPAQPIKPAATGSKSRKTLAIVDPQNRQPMMLQSKDGSESLHPAGSTAGLTSLQAFTDSASLSLPSTGLVSDIKQSPTQHPLP